MLDNRTIFLGLVCPHTHRVSGDEGRRKRTTKQLNYRTKYSYFVTASKRF